MDDLNHLKSQFDLREMAHSLLGKGKRSYKYSQFACPFHGGTGSTPSLTVWSDGFTCFSCGVQGSVIDWYMLYDHLTVKEAIDKLKEGVGLQPRPITPAAHYQEPRRNIPYSIVQENALYIDAGISFFNTRGISDPTSHYVPLGVKPLFASYYTLPDGTAVRFESPRYSVPNIFNGKVRAINYRRNDIEFLTAFYKHPQSQQVMKDLELRFGDEAVHNIVDECGGPKYQQERGSQWKPFNVQMVRTVDDGAIVTVPQPFLVLHAESKEFDTLAMMDAGFPCVGVNPTAEMRDVIPVLFLEVPLLYIIRDSDEPGLRKAMRLQEMLGRGRIISPPEGYKDSGEVIQAGIVHKWLGSFGLDPVLKETNNEVSSCRNK